MRSPLQDSQFQAEDLEEQEPEEPAREPRDKDEHTITFRYSWPQGENCTKSCTPLLGVTQAYVTTGEIQHNRLFTETRLSSQSPLNEHTPDWCAR